VLVGRSAVAYDAPVFEKNAVSDPRFVVMENAFDRLAEFDHA